MTQKQIIENHDLSHALYEELEALKIRIAFAEIGEEELAEFDQGLASASELDYSEDAQKKALKAIQRKLDKQTRRRFIQKTLPRTFNAIFAVLLVFFIGLTTATATVRSFRLKLMEFIAQIEEHYSTVSLVYDNDYAIVPAEWKGEFYPFYIPGEFGLEYVDDLFNTVRYITEDDRVLEFSEFEGEVYENINVKEAYNIDVDINGSAGIAMVDESRVTIVWSMGDTYFTLYFRGDFDEAKRIAESVQHVQSLDYVKD